MTGTRTKREQIVVKRFPRRKTPKSEKLLSFRYFLKYNPKSAQNPRTNSRSYDACIYISYTTYLLSRPESGFTSAARKCKWPPRGIARRRRPVVVNHRAREPKAFRGLRRRRAEHVFGITFFPFFSFFFFAGNNNTTPRLLFGRHVLQTRIGSAVWTCTTLGECPRNVSPVDPARPKTGGNRRDDTSEMKAIRR